MSQVLELASYPTATAVSPIHHDQPNRGSSTGLDIVSARPASSLDIEVGPALAGGPESDPYGLATGLRDPTQIDLLLRQKSQVPANQRYAPHSVIRRRLQSRAVRSFYESQNDYIQRLLKPVDQHRREAKDTHGATRLRYKIAVNGSFAANVLLAVLQLYGAISSGSLSLFTTMADALFDPMSNLMLLLSNRAVNRVNPERFPSGKARIETVGNIVFCFLMSSVSFILIVLSIRDIATHKAAEDAETTSLHLPSIVTVAVAFMTKLALFIFCWSLRNTYSQVHILWEDHRNDLLINGFGLLTSVGGSKLKWYIDPMGAIILSVLIAFLWLRTAASEFQLLIGVTAEPKMLQHITYISMTHSPAILSLDTVRAYHSGPRIIVEVDVVMDERKSLKECHDVAEELQFKLESLPDVERAYVHIDYETSHKPEHFLKKEL